jgi:hypothetical protein
LVFIELATTMRRLDAFFLVLCFMASASMACQPLGSALWKDSPERVKSNFDGALFVVTARVIDIRNASVLSHPDSASKFDVERATFRVERVFKGTLKPGDTFKVDSGISSCARGVSHQHRFAAVPNERSPAASTSTERWLIYYTPPPPMPRPGPQLPPFEITDSPLSRPAQIAAYDIDILMRFARGWTGAGGP